MAADGDDVDLSFESLIFGTPDTTTKKNGNNNGKKKSREKEKDKKFSKIEEESEEVEKNVILVATDKFGDKLNSEALLKAIEPFGALKTHNFRDNQSFGFLQYEDDQEYEKALATLQGFDLDGVKISGERCLRISAGRDPRTHEASSEFKNVTLVLKNLAFHLKLDQLQDILNAQPFQPLSVAYLYDAAAMFRGMAFVKFREIDQAQAVFQAINGMDIHGRKLRVEYKRTLKEGEGGDDDKKLLEQLVAFKNQTHASHQQAAASGLQLGTSPDISFHCPSSFQRKSLHQMAEKLGLVHYSTGEGDNQFVVVRCKDNAERSKETQAKDIANNTNNHNGNNGNNGNGSVTSAGTTPTHNDPKGRDIAQSRSRRGSEAKHGEKNGASWGGFSGGSSWGKASPGGRSPDDRSNGFGKARNNSISQPGAHSSSQGNMGIPTHHHSAAHHSAHSLPSTSTGGASSKPLSMPASDVRLTNGHYQQQSQQQALNGAASFGTSPSYRNSALLFNRAQVNKDQATIHIARQPRGPDGTNGFSTAYRSSRKNSNASSQASSLTSSIEGMGLVNGTEEGTMRFMLGQSM